MYQHAIALHKCKLLQFVCLQLEPAKLLEREPQWLSSWTVSLTLGLFLHSSSVSYFHLYSCQLMWAVGFSFSVNGSPSGLTGLFWSDIQPAMLSTVQLDRHWIQSNLPSDSSSTLPTMIWAHTALMSPKATVCHVTNVRQLRDQPCKVECLPQYVMTLSTLY